MNSEKDEIRKPIPPPPSANLGTNASSHSETTASSDASGAKGSTTSSSSGNTKSKKPLPAPPTFDPSSIKVPLINTSTGTTGTSKNNTVTKSTLDLNLPKPPPLLLPLPTKKNANKASDVSSDAATPHKSNRSSIISSSYTKPFHKNQHIPVQHTSASSHQQHDNKEATTTHIHSTVEGLPTLESAPSSVNLSIHEHEHEPLNSNLESATRNSNDHILKEAASAVSAMTASSKFNTFQDDGITIPHHDKDQDKNNDHENDNDDDDDDDDDEPTIPHHPKRNYRYTQQPPHNLLTYTQRSIPILVIPSPKAKLIAAKNNLSLSDLLNGLGNSMVKESPAILGKLAPIRGVNRLVHLKWDMVSFMFMENFGYDVTDDDLNMDMGSSVQGNETANTNADTKNNVNLPPVDAGMEWEKRLGFASEVWGKEEDFASLEKEIESSIFQRNSMHDDDDDRDPNDFTSQDVIPDNGFSLLSQYKTPWYARFRHGINQQTSHQRCSMMHCPPVVLYVGTSSEGIQGLEDLLARDDAITKHLPEEFRNGLFNFNSMREQYLILHDEDGHGHGHGHAQGGDGDETGARTGDGPFDEVKLLQNMRNRFGPGCAAVVRVNTNTNVNTTGAASSDQEEDTLWDESLTPDTPRSQLDFTRSMHKTRGALLSSRDKLSLRRFISHMTTTVVIPAIERRIYELNVEVTNHKKGVKNVFKSFWRKPKDVGGLNSSVHGSAIMNQSVTKNKAGGGDNGPDSVPYAYDSIESQTRLLADTLFLIRDYEGALGMYRLVKDDYKHDHKLLHNASAHEMMALSMHLTDLSTGYRSTREIIQCIDTAFSLYSAAAEEERLKNGGSRPLVAPIATRCVTRLSLLLSATRMLCQGRDMETADYLASASSNETSLGAAILLEQSSGHYHRAGMYRKFAFHILMAGHMFRSAGQEAHSVRCFASALSVYHGGDRYWPELFNHLTSALAGQLYTMKRMQLSLQLYAKLVGTTGGGRVSVRSQQKFLDHLVTICRSFSADALESSKRMKSAYYGNTTAHWDEAREIILGTPNVTQILEIPNMNLPKIIDSSITVENSFQSSDGKDIGEDFMTFGKAADGLDSMWQGLMCCAEAELRIGSRTTEQSSIDFTNSVLEEIEEEEKKLQTKSRLKKMSNKAEAPPTRAKLEPISVSFDVSNPLSIMVPISSMQLVARLTHSKTQRVYTNIESLDIASSDNDEKSSKKWKFTGSEKLFEVADFSRISPATDSNENIWHSGCANDVDPYFLVSKGQIAMEPRSTSRISLELCPLAMGDLEIVGVRCKVFNGIWVFHKFKVKGPLLHNNAFNRANRIRGPPRLLLTKIESNMPSISVDIIQRFENGIKPVVLQGQVSKWILRVSNQGAAHATNLCLKTNVPWFNIRCNSAVAECDEVSYCIGPSGTMMRLPLGRNNIPTETLAPGQTLDIPIEIRTSGGGRQELYMLFRYELFEKRSASKSLPPKPKTRWLRKMVSVAVYPSLTLAASITPSFSNKKDCILSVEVSFDRSEPHFPSLQLNLIKFYVALRLQITAVTRKQQLKLPWIRLALQARITRSNLW